MKRIALFVLLAAALRLSGWLPFESRDVARLVPIEALVVSIDGEEVILDGGEAQGRGRTWTEALADLDRSAAGDVFLSTAEQLILTGSAVTLLPEIVQSNALRPAAQVCFAPEAPPDPSEAADYLSAHEMDWTVQRVRTALLRGEAVRLPVLAETEGGLRLYA